MVNQEYQIKTELQQLISAEQAYHYRIIPKDQQNGSLSFITDTEDKLALQSELGIILGKEIKLITDSSKNIQNYLYKNYRKKDHTTTKELHYKNDFLMDIIQEAKNIGSSDIHFEIFEELSRVRF